VCRSGQKLGRCARRLTLLDPFEGDDDDDDQEDEEGKDEEGDEGGVGMELWRCGGCLRAALAEPVSAASASSSSSSWSLSRRPFAWFATASAALAEHEAAHAGTAAAARPSCAVRSQSARACCAPPRACKCRWPHGKRSGFWPSCGGV
jgi:hypothetical protein